MGIVFRQCQDVRLYAAFPAVSRRSFDVKDGPQTQPQSGKYRHHISICLKISPVCLCLEGCCSVSRSLRTTVRHDSFSPVQPKTDNGLLGPAVRGVLPLSQGKTQGSYSILFLNPPSDWSARIFSPEPRPVSPFGGLYDTTARTLLHRCPARYNNQHEPHSSDMSQG